MWFVEDLKGLFLFPSVERLTCDSKSVVFCSFMVRALRFGKKTICRNSRAKCLKLDRSLPADSKIPI